MTGYISIRQVMDDVLDNPLLKDMTLERAVNYAQEFMRIVGCPKLFEDKVAEIEVHEYRAPLPCDFISIIQVRGPKGEEYRYTTDNFHNSHDDMDAYQGRDLTYKVQGDVIFTSNREGVIQVAYKSILVDNDGFPLVKDEASYIRALELYIEKKGMRKLFQQGKISAGIYQDVQQEYSFAVGQAQTDLIKPSMDEMEEITNMWNTLVTRANEHKDGFRTLGTREFIRVQ